MEQHRKDVSMYRQCPTFQEQLALRKEGMGRLDWGGLGEVTPPPHLLFRALPLAP